MNISKITQISGVSLTRGGYLSVYRNSDHFFTKNTISEPLFTPRPSKTFLGIAGNLIDIPEKEWNDLGHNFFYYSMYFDVEVRFSSKSWKSEYNQSSKMFTMDRKYVKHWFKITHKPSKVTFESTDIISDHSDTLKAKVDRGESVQVIRMIIWDHIHP